MVDLSVVDDAVRKISPDFIQVETSQPRHALAPQFLCARLGRASWERKRKLVLFLFLSDL